MLNKINAHITRLCLKSFKKLIKAQNKALSKSHIAKATSLLLCWHKYDVMLPLINSPVKKSMQARRGCVNEWIHDDLVRCWWVEKKRGMNSGEDTNEVSMAQSTGITFKIYENWATLYANKTSSECDVCPTYSRHKTRSSQWL